MTETSKAVLERFQIRKTGKQKAAFRDWLCRELEQMGYAPAVEREKTLWRSHNVVAGDPDGAELLLTAHYDTCAVLPFPNFITPRNMAAYLCYQAVLTVGIIVLAALAELLLLFAWPACPMWLTAAVCIGTAFFFLWWILDGKANRHTANDNTSGVITLLEIAAALPAQQRERVCFVFFDNEEKGLLGASAFAKRHRTARQKALVLNFDCVSDGDYIQLYPDKRVRKDADTVAALETAFVGGENKRVEVVKGFGFYPSDQKAFSRGVGVCALKKKKWIGYYMDRIHTGRDTVLDAENIRLLRDGVLRLLQPEIET